MSRKDDIISALVHHFSQEGEVILLESQMDEHPASERSYLAALPQSSISVYGNEVRLCREDGTIELTQQNAWEAFNDFYTRSGDWVFGYLGYDLKNGIEDLHSENRAAVRVPDLLFFVPGFLAEIDAEGELKVIRGEIPETEEAPSANFRIRPRFQTEKENYIAKVRQAQQHIRDGDYYEVNLSHPLEYEFEGDPWALYLQMKAKGPVPFGSYIKAGDFEICSASPERFLAKRGARVWSQPIKGTIHRAAGDEEQQIERLRQSEKERAENLMIVDLVRNDLSKVARKGTVRVRDLFEIQSFQTVHQMVSTVECEVDPAVPPVEIIRECFPMGSMTGAPKISAMKAIEELEDYRRGIYSGAIGYLKPEGDFDLNVVIRTAIIQGDQLSYPVGGAITGDSDPELEWEETLVKSRALTEAIN